MASPKQPQSVTGLNIASTKVRIVKNAIKNNATQAVKFLNNPVNKATPIRNSAPLRRNERKSEIEYISGKPAEAKYSLN